MGGPFALDMKVLPFVFDTVGVKKKHKEWLILDLKMLTAGWLSGNNDNVKK